MHRVTLMPSPSEFATSSKAVTGATVVNPTPMSTTSAAGDNSDASDEQHSPTHTSASQVHISRQSFSQQPLSSSNWMQVGKNTSNAWIRTAHLVVQCSRISRPVPTLCTTHHSLFTTATQLKQMDAGWQKHLQCME